MELHEALGQISQIRQQMARSEVFRGYRSVSVGCSGLLAIVVAACQPWLIPMPANALELYLGLWLLVAAASVLMAAGEMMWRAQMVRSAMTRQMTLLAVEQFLPSVVVGAVVTLCIYRNAPEAAWMLPGLWCLVYSLGVFASYRLLPRQIFFVGIYYLVCGVVCLLWGGGANTLSAWQMGVSFGGGQLLCAGVLYWTLERKHGAQT